MKLKNNEKLALKLMVSNPDISNNEIAENLGITTQAVGKIKRQLHSKGIIERKEYVLNYEKIGVGLLAFALIKIMPKAFRKFSKTELDKILQPPNVIQSYVIPQTSVTHIMVYAFRNVDEYDNYFKKLQTELGEFVEIKEAFILSPKSMIKSSPKEMFLKIIDEYGKAKELPEPDLMVLGRA